MNELLDYSIYSMRRLFIPFIIASLFLWSCSSQYSITGVSSVSMLDGKMLFVKALKGNEWVNIDSTEVIHGNFSMEGSVDTALLASLFAGDKYITPFILENGKIDMNIEQCGVRLKGTTLNEQLNSFIMQKANLDGKAYWLSTEESRLVMDGHSLEEIHLQLEKEYLALSADMEKLVRSFIESNYENILGPSLFLMMGGVQCHPMFMPMMEDLLSKAPDKFLRHPYVRVYTSIAQEHVKACPEKRNRPEKE